MFKNQLLILIILLFPNCFGYVEESLYFESVEEQPAGTLMGFFDSSNSQNYRISGNEESKNHIDLDFLNGTIKVGRKIDRESLKSDQLTLALVDEDTLSIKTIKIRITDLNDNDPQFPNSYYNVSILETATLGTHISLPSAFDLDKGENGTIVVYQLQNQSQTFAIASPSPNTNESASLYLTSQLDRELYNTYELILIAFDGGNPSRRGQMTIFVNVQDSNEAPQFENQDYNVKIDASSFNKSLLKLKAIDVDSGYNGMLYYQIQSDPTYQFEINNQTGEIFIKSNVEILNCNKNGRNVCLLTIEAIDGGNPPLKARTVVRIQVDGSNLYTPVIKMRTYPLGYNATFVNELAKTDTVVAVLTIIDKDNGLAGTTELDILAGNEGNWFRLEKGNNFGIIRVVRLESIANKRFYELTIRVKDKGMPSRSSQQTLKLIVYDDAASYKYLDENNNQTYSICQGLPCYSGTCQSDICQCFDEFTGTYCNERIFGFKFGTSLRIKSSTKIQSFSMQFRSSSNNGLLLYSNSLKNDHFSIQLLNGNLHINGQIEDNHIDETLELSQLDEYSTLMLNFETNSTLISINNNTTNSTIAILNNEIFIGGSHNSSSTFYGCIKSIHINNQALNDPSLSLTTTNIMPNCPFNNKISQCSIAQKACQNGRCVDSWEGYYCVCGDEGFEAMDCRLENSTVASSGAKILLQKSQYSLQKLHFSANNKQIVRDLDDRIFDKRHNFSYENWSQGELVERIESWPSQWIELELRTGQKNSTIFRVKSKNQEAMLRILNGELYYGLFDLNGNVISSLHLNGSLICDRRWHRITVEVGSDSKSVRLKVDNAQMDSIVHSNFPQFLSNELDFIEIGSDSFYGCIRRLLLNNQLIPIGSSNGRLLEKRFFQIHSINGSLNDGCSDKELCSMENDCPMMPSFLHNVTLFELAIFVFILMLIVICALIFLNLRRHLQKRQRLNNIQRVSNLQLISTCDSEYAHDNAVYNSNMDFTYLPSYIPIYSNIIYPPNEICSCNKFDYEDIASNQYYLQGGSKFQLENESQECSLSSSSTDIPLDPSSLHEYRIRPVSYDWNS